MPTAMNDVSEKLTAVDDFAPWSSLASAIAPPLGEAPVKLAWRRASPDRSTPGPLPYQMPNTPSTVAPGKLLRYCAPQIAVAARSSLRPGRKTMLCCLRNGPA